jgi:hypothetical protein
MSLKLAREYIDKAIKSTPEYSSINNIRQAKRTEIHSLNISYSTFETNNKSIIKLSTSDLKYFYSLFIVAIKNAIGKNRIYASLTSAEAILSRDELLKSSSGCILVGTGVNTSIIGYDYDAIRRVVTSAIKSRQAILNSPLGAEYLGTSAEGEIRYKSILELGHTLTSTPFAETIKLVLAYSNNTTLNSELNAILDRLYDIQASIGYEFLNKSDNSGPGSAIIKLVIQPKDVNKELSKQESTLYRSFLNSIVKNLDLTNVPGSNTLKQDAVQFYTDHILSAITGKKVANVKKHSPVAGNVSAGKSNKDSKNKVSSFKNNDIVKAIAAAPSTPNLINLQNLINQQLQDVISANMGSGRERNVLNYRTGRLASSAKVEYMSESRQGMITAFYSYMKNPYATFSQGGRQENPKSRDPKLLISRSIREIAQTQVSNTLRAVNI